MEKFEYGKLEHKLLHGNWYFFANEERLGAGYEYLSLIEALNIVGNEGWRLVLNPSQDVYILMRTKKD